MRKRKARRKKAERPQPRARRMVPLAEVLGMGLVPVMQVLVERGLVAVTEDKEAMADAVIEILREQGMIKVSAGVDYVVAGGQCLLLPHPAGGLFSLMPVTPVPADEYTDDLRRKPSPVRFDRTAKDEIILPSRWFLARLEEIANNPVASEALRTLALNMSHRAVEFPDVVLPPEAETVAMNVAEKDGTVTTFEALPPGFVISVEARGKEG